MTKQAIYLGPDIYLDGERANRQLDDLRSHNAALENALKFMGRNVCVYRNQGECLAGCLGIVVCDVEGLRLVG